MKQYREIAHCRNAEDKVIYVILFNSDIKQYEYVSWDYFCQLVQNEKVQFFIWDYYKNEPMVYYSDEELNSMAKADKKLVQYANNIDDYFANDVIISESSMQLLLDDITVIASAVAPLKVPLVGTVMPVLLIGTRQKLAQVVAELSQKYKSSVFECKGCTYFHFNDMFVKKGIYSIEDFSSITVDFTLLERMGYDFSDLLKKAKPLSVIKGPSLRDCSSIIDLCIKINKMRENADSGATSPFMNLF